MTATKLRQTKYQQWSIDFIGERWRDNLAQVDKTNKNSETLLTHLRQKIIIEF